MQWGWPCFCYYFIALLVNHNVMHCLLAIKSRDLFLLIIAISFAQTYFPQADEIILLVGITLWMGWTYVIPNSLKVTPKHTKPF